MLTEWQDFMNSHGARIEGGTVRDFGNPDHEAAAASIGNVVTDLSFLAVVKVSGADAAAFLDQHFTTDIRQLPDADPQLGAWCNATGHAITDFLIVKFGEEYFLTLPAELAEGFVRRLEESAGRARVTLEDCRRTFQCIGYKHADGGVSGADIAHRLSIKERAIRLNGLVMLHMPVNWNRVIIFGLPATVEMAWSNLAQMYTRVGSRYWQLFDIVDGWPWILTATTETLLPQELNLDVLQEFSQRKNLSASKNAAVRLDGGGRHAHRLYVATLRAEAPVQPGTKLYAPDGAHSVGCVVNAFYHSEVDAHALLTLDNYHGNIAALNLEDRAVVRVTKIMSPPYLARPR